MPSPLGHSVMGYMIYRATARPVGRYRWQRTMLYLFAANVPDLDFIPGFVIGDPNLYHHGISHSIGFALLFAATFSLFLALQKQETIGRNFAIFLSLYGSHIALDYFSIDTSAPYGEPLFWPISNEYYIAPFAFLPDIWRASSSIEFMPSLFNLHNLWAVSVEFLLLFPFILLVSALRKQGRVSTHANSPASLHAQLRSGER
jgi:inner membrane protein